MATDFFLNLPGGSGGGGGATPGGVNGEIQWNDAGTLAGATITTDGTNLNLNGGPFLGGNGATLQDANDSFGGWRLTGSDTTSTTISSISNGMYLGSGNDINTVSRYPNAYAAINDSFWGDNGTYSSFYVQMNNADMSADVPFFIRGDGSFQLGGTALPFQAGGPAGASMWGDASQNLFFNGHIVSMNDGSGSGGGTLNMDGAQIKNIGYSTSAPTLAANSEFGFSYNEGTNAFTITVKRSDGVVKTGTVICT